MSLDKKYVSSVNFLDEREILNKVLDITNEEMSFLDLIELSKRSTVTKVPTYHHFINEELYVVGTATSAITGSGTTAITATIDATAYAAARVGDLVVDKLGKVGYVKTKAGSNAITVKSVDSAVITVTTGDKLSFFSRADAEGSLSPTSQNHTVTKYFNQVHTFKEKFDVTDIQKTSQVTVDFGGRPFYMYKGQHESLTKFRGNIASAAWFSRISDSLYEDASPELVDAEGLAVQTTMGVNQYVETYGVLQALLTSQAVSLADLTALTQTLNRARCPMDYFLFVGTSMNIAWDNYFNAIGNGATIGSAARFSVEGKNLDFGVDSVKLYGRTFHKKQLDLLNHKNIVSYTGAYNFSNAAYGIPSGKIKTVDGSSVDRLGMRYMSGDGTDLKYREIVLGGLAPTPTSERSVLEFHYQSTQGVEILGAQHCFKLY